ncbi:MAG: aminotransferase class III-fold pyridoxal phosphate-dependent enzyme [Pirellulaceae bacterium]
MSTVIQKQYNRLSKPFGPEQLRLLESNISRKVPFYVRMQISSYEARTGYLLNELVNLDHASRRTYYSFFSSSTTEAISGAVKLVRHNHFTRLPDVTPLIAVFDPTSNLQETFDPLASGVNEAFAPGFEYFTNIDTLRDFTVDHPSVHVMIRLPEQLSLDVIDDIMLDATRRRVFTILDESSTDLSQVAPVSSQLRASPDVIVFGENLGDHRVPTACFIMRDDVYRVWGTGKDYNLHSNTWGGNSISLANVLSFLETTPGYRRLDSKVPRRIADASQSHTVATQLYSDHCSPKMAKMLKLGGLNKNIRSAYQTQIETLTHNGSRSVIDASGTYGVNLQGHNPMEMLDDVVRRHDVRHDYWNDLESLLSAEVGLPHILPAVSGGTSVEAALVAALLAAAPKKKVIALTGGFGGKTLISLIGTSREKFKTPFGPLYPHVSYVNPFVDSGRDELSKHLETGDVAVVIMEMIQGEGGVRACPQSFIDFLNEQKERHGFFIAVDEVQTGMYRTGRFLNCIGKVTSPDIIAMGKALSNNVFPVSAALLSAEVYQKAMATNPDALSRYQNQFRCQFGAHVAIHAIESGKRLGLAEHARTAGEYFRSRLADIAKDLDFVKEVRGEGLMIGIEFEESKLPKLLRASFGGLLASRCVNDPLQPVLVAFNPDKPFLIRFVPPLCITMQEIDAVIETFRRALHSGHFGLLKPIVTNLINAKLGRY